MRIPLNLDAKPVKKIPYQLNPLYKKKVKAEIDRMVGDWIIETIVELEWISSMVI
jgi:hypothetical protein